jgi:hypothetical protein
VAARQEEGWRRVGIRGVVGGGAPGDRGVPCGEGLGGVGTGVWRGGARTVRAVHGDQRGGGWRRKGTRRWRVVAQKDRRGGVVLGWCGD